MQRAYSRLAFLLSERSLSHGELRRRLLSRGIALSAKSLSRLTNIDEPLERIDLRLLGEICALLGIGLSELITFADTPTTDIESLSAADQRRLDELLDRNAGGTLGALGMQELRALVERADEISRQKTRRLVEHRQHIARAGDKRRQAVS
jgi:DNA-binding Xre family transcriptional regulator